MSAARSAHATVLLDGDALLVCGGYEPIQASCERLDPSTLTFVPAPSLDVPRNFAKAVKLPSGAALLCGGGVDQMTPFFSSCLRLDPGAPAWVDAGFMTVPRGNHSLTVMEDGRVLAAGGFSGGGVVEASAEVYTPATGQWVAVGPMSSPRVEHAAVLLHGGAVLLVGGDNGANNLGDGGTDIVDQFDPATNQWSTLAPLPYVGDGFGKYARAARLPDQSVVVLGVHNQTVRYFPTSNTWLVSQPMAENHGFGELVAMPDGGVLANGGFAGSGAVLASSDTYEPANNSWSRFGIGDMAEARYRQQAVAVANSVLVVGGQSAGFVAVASTEWFGAPRAAAPPDAGGTGGGAGAGGGAATGGGGGAGGGAAGGGAAGGGAAGGGAAGGGAVGGGSAGGGAAGGGAAGGGGGSAGGAAADGGSGPPELRVGCGCRTGEGPLAALGLAVVALARRRARG